MASSLGIAVYALAAAVLFGQVMQTVTQRKQYRCVSLPHQPEEPERRLPRGPLRTQTPSVVPKSSTAVPKPLETDRQSQRKNVRKSQRTAVPKSPTTAATGSAPPPVTTRPRAAASKSPTDSFSLFRLPLQLISRLLLPLKHSIRQNTTSIISPLFSFNMPLTFSKVQSPHPLPFNTNDPPSLCDPPPPSDAHKSPSRCDPPPPSSADYPSDPFKPLPYKTDDPPDPCDPSPPPAADNPPKPRDPPPGNANDDPSDPCRSENTPVPCNPVPGTVEPVFPVEPSHGNFDDTVGLLCDVLWYKFGYSCSDYAREPATNGPCETSTVVATSASTTSAAPYVVGPPPVRVPCPPTPCKPVVPHARRHGAVPGAAHSHRAPSKQDRPDVRPLPSERSESCRTSDHVAAGTHPQRHDFLGVLRRLVSSYVAPSAPSSTVNVRPHGHFKMENVQRP